MGKITVDIADDDLAFLNELAERDGFAGPDDCLRGLVGWALVQWRDKVEGHCVHAENRKRLEGVISDQAVRISVLSELLLNAIEAKAKQALEYEDKLRGRWMAVTTPTLRPRRPGDPDDGIPF